MSELEFPSMRNELIDYLRGLSDRNHQHRVWVDEPHHENIDHENLDYAIHFLYDDTELAENPHETIGFILRDAKEAELVKSLVASLDRIFSKYGLDLDDSDYIKLPEWDDVIECAKTTLQVIQ